MTQLCEGHSVLRSRRGQAGFRESAAFLPSLMLFCLTAVSLSVNAYCHAGDPIRQSKQDQSGSGHEKDIRALEAGKPIKRELAGGQEHSYRIELNANQFLNVTVEQHGIDVVVQVSGPDGKQILEFDSESRSYGREDAPLLAEAAGSFLFIVRPRYVGTSAGSYEIRIEESRVATDTDRALHDSRRQYNE